MCRLSDREMPPIKPRGLLWGGGGGRGYSPHISWLPLPVQSTVKGSRGCVFFVEIGWSIDSDSPSTKQLPLC